jgi:putative addiction module CopG family antidote
MTIHLPEGREAFVRSLLADGRFASESEVVDQALGLLEERERQRVETPEPADSPSAHKPIWEVIQEISATVPGEVWDTVPTDLAAQHDHYLYGTPKRIDL